MGWTFSTWGEVRNAYRTLFVMEEVILESTDSGYDPMAGCCEHDNVPAGSIKILFHDHQLLKKGFAPWNFLPQ
jgi:hypothetical protein